MIVFLHRSGTEVVKMLDGGMIVRRGCGSVAERVADAVEDFLWTAGYGLIAGGGPGQSVSLYRAPR